MSAEKKIINIIVEQLQIEREKVTLDANLMDDLGANSLDLVELVMTMEKEFDLEITDEVAEKITTVREVSGSVIAALTKSATGYAG